MLDGNTLIIAELLAQEPDAPYMQHIGKHCERCKSKNFIIIDFNENIKLYNIDDIVIERQFYLRCYDCGAEEADVDFTIIPSWVYHPMREKLQEERRKCK